MNNIRVISYVVGGILVFVEVQAAFETAMNCPARSCFGLPYANIPLPFHIPEGNNNSFAPPSTVVGYAGTGNSNGNNSFFRLS